MTTINGAWSNQTNNSLLGVNKKLEIRKCHHIQHSPCIEMTNFIFFKEHQLFGGVSLTLQDLTHNPPFYLWQSRVHPSDTSFYFSNVCHKPSMQHHLITNNVVSRDLSMQNQNSETRSKQQIWRTGSVSVHGIRVSYEVGMIT